MRITYVLPLDVGRKFTSTVTDLGLRDSGCVNYELLSTPVFVPSISNLVFRVLDLISKNLHVIETSWVVSS